MGCRLTVMISLGTMNNCILMFVGSLLLMVWSFVCCLEQSLEAINKFVLYELRIKGIPPQQGRGDQHLGAASSSEHAGCAYRGAAVKTLLS